MSTTLAEFSGVNVTRYAGAAVEGETTRRRYQITNEATGEYVTLSEVQLFGFVEWLASTDGIAITRGEGIES